MAAAKLPPPAEASWFSTSSAGALGPGPRESRPSPARPVVAWTEEHAPSLHAGGAGPVARAVEVCRTPHLSLLTDAVLDATIPVPVAVTVADQYHRIRHRLHPDATDTVLAAMITIGSQHGSRGVRDLRDRLIARYGLHDELQRDHDAAAELIALSAPVRDGALRHYRLTLDTENAAILEAAIGPATRPTPGPDGEPDHRTPSRRQRRPPRRRRWCARGRRSRRFARRCGR